MIYYPKVFGVCNGSNKAIKLSYELKDKYKDKNIYIYKEILHNEYIINELERNNIRTINSLEGLTKDDIVIIRAHGEPKETYDYLDKKGVTYFDATCVNVKSVHDLAIKKKDEGYKIIIVGKKNHPEVIGTNGHINNEGIIIENESDYKELNKNIKYFVLCQTTTSYETLSNLINYMTKNKFEFDYKNTICNAQKLIQTSSVELAKSMDIMFVIGGQNSSNTKELYNMCSKVCKTYYFSDLDTFSKFIKTHKITKNTKIGFTGGASTPKAQIYDYASLLEFFIYYLDSKKNIEKEMIKFNKFIGTDNNSIINDALDKFKYANSDGKCIRGTLINLGYNTHKNDNDSMALAGAYESFETAILIHDDIIDNADLRRGKKTTHKLYEEDFKHLKQDNTPTSLALCIGDIGFYYTYQYIVKHYKNHKYLNKILEYYNEISIDTIKGEILDVYLPYVEKYDKNHKLFEDDILSIYKLKTAKYTIIGPFILGLILSGGSKTEIKEFTRILEGLGIAFQIKDDILGIFSDTTTIGKPVFSDVEEFKQTILYSYLKVNKSKYLNDLLKYYGNKINENDLKEVQNILIKSGSLDYANNKMSELFNYSKEEIKKLKIKDNIKNILLGLIIYLEIRKK